MFSSVNIHAVSIGLATFFVASALVAIPSRVQAQSTTITFATNACSGLGNSGQGYNRYSGRFNTQGYRFDASPVQVWATPCVGQATYTGTTTLYPDNVGSTVTLSTVSGSPFSISSIDLAALFGFPSTQVVTFTGIIQGGGVVNQSFTVTGPTSGAPVLSSFTFLPTFTNLASVGISSNVQPYYQFTNVRVTAVPELGTFSFLSAGVLMIILGQWRRMRHHNSML